MRSVEDASMCERCGTFVKTDREGEYRQRVLLEDRARSHGARHGAKLCHSCWNAVRDFVQGADDE